MKIHLFPNKLFDRILFVTSGAIQDLEQATWQKTKEPPDIAKMSSEVTRNAFISARENLLRNKKLSRLAFMELFAAPRELRKPRNGQTQMDLI